VFLWNGRSTHVTAWSAPRPIDFAIVSFHSESPMITPATMQTARPIKAAITSECDFSPVANSIRTAATGIRSLHPKFQNPETPMSSVVWPGVNPQEPRNWYVMPIANAPPAGRTDAIELLVCTEPHDSQNVRPGSAATYTSQY